jgi:ribosome-binding protein aMBF1 (putative translation factor)
MVLMIMSRMPDPDHQLDEFDMCSLCGRGTPLLITVRADLSLIDVCGQCIDGLKKGYEAMMHQRMQFDLSFKEPNEPRA